MMNVRLLSVCVVWALTAWACEPRKPGSTAQSSGQGASKAEASTAKGKVTEKTRDISPAKRAPLAAPSRLLSRPRTPQELATTDWRIFMRNLKAQVKTSQVAAQRRPTPATLKLSAEKLLTLGRILGDVEMVGRAVKIADLALEKAPKAPGLLALRAQARFTLHQWTALAADVAALEAVAPRHPSLEELKAELMWHRGEFKAATVAFTALAKSRPDLYRVSRLGHVLARRGGFDAGDKAFARAETLYRDVSPVPLAWLYVQRALLRIEHGRYAEAKLFLEAAYARAPGYPMVVEHLAEVNALVGDRQQAVKLYEEAIALVDHPEYHGALAGVLRALARSEQAEKHEAKAGERAQILMEKYPEAMAGHCVELLAGEARRNALTQLQAEAAQRHDPETQGRFAAALIDADRAPEALAVLQKTLKEDWHLPRLHWLAARAARLGGAPEQAATFKARALALNPDIEALYGPF